MVVLFFCCLCFNYSSASNDVDIDYTIGSNIVNNDVISNAGFLTKAVGANNADENYYYDDFIYYYEVKEGDTLSAIAQRFNLKISTIKGINSLRSDVLKPKQILKIIPFDGLLYTTKTNDNITDLAKKFNVLPDDIAFKNGLGDFELEKDLQIIIPGEYNTLYNILHPPVIRNTTVSRSVNTNISYTNYTPPSGCWRFYPGQCTWYAASRWGCIPWRGNANMWLTNARAAGYPTGNTPVVGSIIQTNESYYGHVGIVTSFSDTQVCIIEMNHKGPYIISERCIPRNSRIILGYIYKK